MGIGKNSHSKLVTHSFYSIIKQAIFQPFFVTLPYLYKMQPFSLYFLNLCKIHNKNVVTSLIFNILFHLSQFFCIKTQITLHCMTSEYSISPTKKRLPTRQSSKNIQLHFAYINRRISSVNSSPEVAYSKVFRGYWFTQSSIH